MTCSRLAEATHRPSGETARALISPECPTRRCGFPPEAEPTRTVLEVNDLKVYDDDKVERLRGISLNVRAGEILGIAGVAGNGQSELLEVLGGITTATGQIKLNGDDLDLTGKYSDGKSRRARGIAHVPEDRQHLGLIMDFFAWENSRSSGVRRTFSVYRI